jgi:hypothetical protein
VSDEATLVADWERSAGLRAPPAPADGVLAPRGVGYLIAIGPPSDRLHPRLATAGRWLPALAVPVIAALPFVLVPAPYGVLGVAGLAALACWLPGKLVAGIARVRLWRRLAAAVRRRQLVRLTGVVAEQKTVPSLLTGRPVVLAVSDCAGVTETRGFDFDVRLDDGTPLRVPARDAILFGRRHRLRGEPRCGPITLTLSGNGPRLSSGLLAGRGFLDRVFERLAYEVTLGPGDVVEIYGARDVEPDPNGERSFGRGPAFRSVVRPAAGLPVCVRLCHEPRKE